MSESIKALGGLTAHEWRRFRRSPVWMIGLLATTWFMLSEGRSSVGWPPANTSLYGYQLAVSVLFGIITFLLAAGSLARDLDYPRSELVFSRPIPVAIYLGGKFLGTVPSDARLCPAPGAPVLAVAPGIVRGLCPVLRAGRRSCQYRPRYESTE